MTWQRCNRAILTPEPPILLTTCGDVLTLVIWAHLSIHSCPGDFHGRYNFQKLQSMTQAAPKPLLDDEKASAEAVPLKTADANGKPASP